jgi:pimeloyl-[acyl-carrier protein] methyl ester esterase
MKDLVLIHGWGFGSAVWRPVVEQLPPRFPLHLVDLPGYGDNDFSPEHIAPGAVVCGWSLGALVALQWAERFPGKVARLVLTGATPRFIQASDWQAAQPPELLDSFASAVAADPRAALRRFAALLNQGDNHARPLTRQLSALLDQRVPESACLADGLDMLRTTDMRDSLLRIRQPALVLHGDRDPLMPLAAGRWLADHLPAGRLEVFAGAAHAPLLSDPRRFAALLAAFANE